MAIRRTPSGCAKEILKKRAGGFFSCSRFKPNCRMTSQEVRRRSFFTLPGGTSRQNRNLHFDP